MNKIINQLENEIKKLSDMSETVTFNNAGESLQLMGDKLDNFLILHKAKLNAILEEIKILNGKIRKDFGKKVCHDKKAIAKDLCAKQIQCRDCKDYY